VIWNCDAGASILVLRLFELFFFHSQEISAPRILVLCVWSNILVVMVSKTLEYI